MFLISDYQFEITSTLIIMFIIIMYTSSHAFRYYTKYAIFTVLSYISATVFIPLMLWRPKDYRNGLLPAWGGRQISKILGLTWEFRGKENIVNDSGCVVLINHQSCLDLLVLSEIWPVMDRCTVISKKEIFYFWPFGLASWLWGTIFIDRLNVESAQNTINKTGETIRQRKAKLCMFPEGTRHGGDELLPFKKGAFHVAISCQCPIQPMVVSQYTFLDHKNRTFDSGHNIITILPPISTEGMTKENLTELIEKARSAMTDVYKKTSEELKTKYYNVS
ncbi:1-acyl-sn-glycerol-3-phosphate acyltransferase beta-like [Adelges cooleyi]|uniref:1-acyl-sn-glycerol-3-phosphate acyltransferase beta-like n=1 Tax=Adelges cooleyi TaxID=133065 RepID=UPI00218004AD|nr:1-acyl-sn-glycerol-3-phosphate acyltransferase beta-like [Adelges cooleyi]XP_050443308.1 1-acyl-sn-glycerol-3-phosphate acyltransferase beta-like [Adelges cooleyi]XP_050443309.1 1-acyl-sn-glycerol-3-phosphate acyltransferase beta-like [Adelges cooleyi]XP_050443311.1 1-acyl-sn-glycerol-3-phosphate acyltransferase beta-like [Adelges cooleyi]